MQHILTIAQFAGCSKEEGGEKSPDHNGATGPIKDSKWTRDLRSIRCVRRDPGEVRWMCCV